MVGDKISRGGMGVQRTGGIGACDRIWEVEVLGRDGTKIDEEGVEF